MILNSPTISGSLTVTGNIIASGSITLSGSVTSASYAASASNALAAQTASYVLTAQTASFVALAQSASNAVSAATASSADNLLVRNTLTAQTLVVQTITSSVDFVTGSTRFGSSLSTSTHQFTGSVSITGSLAVVTNGTEFQVTSTGVNLGNVIGDAHNITGSVGISGSLTGVGGVTANNFIATSTGNANVFNAASATNGWMQMAMNNTNGSAILGIEGDTAGTTTNGSLAYATILRNYTNTALQIATNNIVRATITGGGNVGIGTANISTEANLHLGAQGTAEGGQLVLQKGTSQVSASHLDNYSNQFRIMSGTDTSSSTVRMSIDMTNGAMAYGNGGMVDIEWAGGGGASTHTLDLATAFPNISFTGVQITAVCEVQTVNGTTAGSSHIVMFNRTINGVWASTTISTVNNGGGTVSSSSGSGTTLTINHTNAGAMRGQVRVTIRG